LRRSGRVGWLGCRAGRCSVRRGNLGWKSGGCRGCDSRWCAIGSGSLGDPSGDGRYARVVALTSCISCVSGSGYCRRGVCWSVASRRRHGGTIGRSERGMGAGRNGLGRCNYRTSSWDTTTFWRWDTTRLIVGGTFHHITRVALYVSFILEL